MSRLQSPLFIHLLSSPLSLPDRFLLLHNIAMTFFISQPFTIFLKGKFFWVLVQENNIVMSHSSQPDIGPKSVLNLLAFFLLCCFLRIFLLINESIAFVWVINAKYTTSHSLFVVFEFSLSQVEFILPISILSIVDLNLIKFFLSNRWMLQNYWLVKDVYLLRVKILLILRQTFSKVVILC